MQIFDIIAVLIFFSGLFIFLNTFYLKLPSSIGLSILALLLSFLVLIFGLAFPQFHLAEHVKAYDMEDVLIRFVLSVMLFAGALNIDFGKLGKQLVPVIVLAFFGVLISTFVIGTFVYYMLDFMNIELSYLGALIFGALISSTDPVAVTKMIQRHQLSNELENKISGESLLNGGIAIVLALVLMSLYKEQAITGALSLGGSIWVFLRDLGGGLIVGLFFGWLGYQALKYIDNDEAQVEVLITMALVMVGSYVANYLNVSSMLVAVLSGLVIRNSEKSSDGESAVGAYVFKFWQLMEESMAAMLFVLIGFEMLVIPLRLDYFAAGFFALNIVLFARWISVFLPIKFLANTHAFDKGTVSVLSWGALRGGLPVAVSLSLTGFPGQEIIVTMTYVVVVCSVLYQGLTLGKLVRSYQAQQYPSHQMKV
ncbi:sodium:proton antiporter [Reichenbachiella carrageenanivorans]|uniref:Sodium:proton antiporter n=1 Tax=Reichenbachiella carrageenanivorans TaxID=2979869 RepID=A0ABY6CZM7_9BACT|nr:sodium:proton antiporter [Reichenbachiella carrageenanivorans]UXX79356.1 sodium:proton antiporter [Reichenbachiella carrageenanivorans]